MQCFILAGGFATRLWPLTEKRAKPLLPLAGKPIITHLVENVPRDLPITVSTNAVFQHAFEEWKHELTRDICILIEDSIHDDHKIGALGAVSKWMTEEKIADDVLLLTGDNYVGFSLEGFILPFHGKTLIAAYEIGNIERAKSYGTVLTEGSTVTGFEEKPHEPKTTLVNTGVSLLPRHILPVLVEFAMSHPDNIGGIFEELIRRGERVECFRFENPWFDIGSFESYLEATKTLVGEQIVLGHQSTIEGSTTEGSVVLGVDSHVQKSTLRNVVLFDHCQIDDCELENCILDNTCQLKGIDLRGKMLREGTKLIV